MNGSTSPRESDSALAPRVYRAATECRNWKQNTRAVRVDSHRKSKRFAVRNWRFFVGEDVTVEAKYFLGPH